MSSEMKTLLDGMLNFYDEEEKVSLSYTPLDELRFIPRVGEKVSFSGVQGSHGGEFTIERIGYAFTSDEIGGEEVRLFMATAYIRRR